MRRRVGRPSLRGALASGAVRLVASLLPAALLAAPLWSASLLAAAAPACAQPRPATAARKLPAGADITARTLPNGLRVIVWPDHDIPNVALYTWHKVGSRNEHNGITGLSHFFEHMMFLGSRNYPSGEFDRIMEANGGANNAYTTQDVTVYSDWFAKSALELVVRMEADRMCCLTFDSTKVRSEREVVTSERRTSVDNNGREFLDESVLAAVFEAHPYQIPTIGWPSDIERWTMTDLKDYFRTYYAPNNAVLVVVGDVTPAEVDALAERYFGPIPAQPAPPAVRTIEPPQLGERRVVVRRPAPVPLLEVAFHAGPADGPDAEAEELLDTILTSGESSRLYRRMVDVDRVAVDVDSWLQRGFDPGVYAFYVTVTPERGAAAAESSLVDELARVAQDGVTEAELHKAKTIQLAGYWQSLETIDGKASALGSYETLRGDYRMLFSAPARYEKVTRRMVRDAARRIFNERNRTVGVLLPEAETSASSKKAKP
jgi:zinc protease